MFSAFRVPCVMSGLRAASTASDLSVHFVAADPRTRRPDEWSVAIAAAENHTRLLMERRRHFEETGWKSMWRPDDSGPFVSAHGPAVHSESEEQTHLVPADVAHIIHCTR